MGRRARERVLDEHTYAHRARQVLRILNLDVAVESRA
jgi:spore maturation protein CgeB